LSVTSSANSRRDTYFDVGICVGSTALLTVGAQLGDILYISPVPNSRSSQPDALGLTEIQEASTVTIREIDGPLGNAVNLKESLLTGDHDARDVPPSPWFPMLLKEKLGRTCGFLRWGTPLLIDV
jgi:hypothetical protein